MNIVLMTTVSTSVLLESPEIVIGRMGNGYVKKSLYDRIFDDITAGKIAGGGRLKIQDLADRYGTSTNPVREVLRQLQGQGIVEFSPNRGATVMKVDSDALRDVFELLQLLEPYFIEWFAETNNSEQIEALEHIQDKIESAPVSDKRTFVELDKQFHGVIANSHYNRKAVENWDNLRNALHFFSYNLPVSWTRHKNIFVEHRSLIDACRKNDVETAVEVCKKHIQGAGEQMYRQLRAAQDKTLKSA